MVEHVREIVVLRRDGAEPGQRLRLAGVGAGRPEGGAHPGGVDLGVDLGVERGHRRVAHDGALEPVGMERGGGDGDEPAHAVAHDDHRPLDAAVVGHRDDLVGPARERVPVPVVAVAVALG